MKNFIFLFLSVVSFNLQAAETAAGGAAMPGASGADSAVLKRNGIITQVEYPVTEFEGNYRGLENGYCRLTYEKINGRPALTVAFNTKENSNRALTSILADSADFPIKEFAEISERTVDLSRHLTYIEGEARLSNTDKIDSTGDMDIMYISADPALKNIRSIRVRFFEDVRRKGRNETGSVVCRPSMS